MWCKAQTGQRDSEAVLYLRCYFGRLLKKKKEEDITRCKGKSVCKSPVAFQVSHSESYERLFLDLCLEHFAHQRGDICPRNKLIKIIK